MRATVYIVDDDEALNHSLKLLLESVGLVVHLFTRAEDFIDAVTPDVVGCVLVDVRMPGMSGLQLQTELATREIGLPIVFLTGYANVDIAVDAMKKGAFDFIEKPCNEQILLETIEKAIQQCRLNLEKIISQQRLRARMATLTERELEILTLVVAGKSSNDIGSELDISAKTVAVHRANMMHKMGARTVAELVKMTLHNMN